MILAARESKKLQRESYQCWELQETKHNGFMTFHSKRGWMNWSTKIQVSHTTTATCSWCTSLRHDSWMVSFEHKHLSRWTFPQSLRAQTIIPQMKPFNQTLQCTPIGYHIFSHSNWILPHFLSLNFVFRMSRDYVPLHWPNLILLVSVASRWLSSRYS